MISTYVNWGESRVKLTWKETNQLPPVNLITSVHGFCFLENKLLLVKLNHRGWDMTGGHMESGESPEDCFRRETMEEAYVAGDCSLQGHVIVDHSQNPQWSGKNNPYPKIGFQVFYSMDITEVFEFDAGFESTERIFIDHNRVQDYYHDWHEVYEHILYCATKKRD